MIKKAGLMRLASLLILFSLLLTAVPVKALAVTQFELEEIQRVFAQPTAAIAIPKNGEETGLKPVSSYNRGARLQL